MAEYDQILNRQCYDAVQRVAKDNGFTNFDVEIESGSSKGDNYLGEIFRVVVREKKDNHKVLHLIVKIALKKYRNDVPIHLCYQREIVAYNEVFKAFKELQNKSKVKASARFDFVECLYNSDENMNELLVFDNLETSGFQMLGRQKRVEYDHAALVLESLAKLHALSFVLKKQNLDQFKDLACKVPDHLASTKLYNEYLGNAIDRAVTSVNNELHKEKLIELKQVYWEAILKGLEVDNYSVICHGDCWINNTLFKYQNGRPIDVRFVDYQILHYGKPAADILYFLFSSTDGQFRQAHYRHCLDHYYHCLSVVLQEFYYSVDEIFPRHEFEKQVEGCALFGLINGIGFIKLIVMEGEDNMDISDIIDPKASALKGISLERYMNRLTGLIQNGIDFSYL